ncbi:MmgE/PrpD family protein [Pantoea vagans]|uniref:MmgE/PrpD family protein n=1 Tax=Pantoea vagans TaxID=470934 RepID=UPI0023B099FD|nr:MmgE/PrpD family protein [Pantoea vagans]MDE8556219.1 MmgE/PrpD family protein [Pantoea vagans]MDE8576270.1 MmgE/PrpD family protein [Pantoea vagans]
MSDYQQQLASFVHQMDFDDIPPALVERCKRHILDTLGAALAGTDSEVYRAVAATVLTDGAAPQAVLWGTPHASSAKNAALLNGVAAHMYELDDTGGCDHSGAVVLPAVLAAMPLCKAPPTGKALITAVMMGYDVGRRVLEACGGYSPHNGAGWHSTATCGVFGAAAAVAKLLGLSAAQISSALGIAGSFSGGLWAFIHDGSQTKKLHAGRAAESGLFAAQLAAGTIIGPEKLFDNVWGGFLSTLAPSSQQPDALTADLGNVWKLERCSIKPYASCRGVHSAIDAMISLRQRTQASRETIERIDVHLCGFLNGMCGGRDLSSLAAAQMSLPYALAACIVYGSAGLEVYDDEKRFAAPVTEMMKRIHLQIDPRQDDNDEPQVVLTLTDGSQQQQRVDIALGAPGNPLSDEQLLQKFRSLATRILPPEQASELATHCLTLEQADDCRVLLPLLSQ